MYPRLSILQSSKSRSKSRLWFILGWRNYVLYLTICCKPLSSIFHSSLSEILIDSSVIKKQKLYSKYNNHAQAIQQKSRHVKADYTKNRSKKRQHTDSNNEDVIAALVSPWVLMLARTGAPKPIEDACFLCIDKIIKINLEG